MCISLYGCHLCVFLTTGTRNVYFSKCFLTTGVQKGDKVAIYMPMILELIVAMLACARIGAVHSIIVSTEKLKNYGLFCILYMLNFSPIWEIDIYIYSCIFANQGFQFTIFPMLGRRKGADHKLWLVNV